MQATVITFNHEDALKAVERNPENEGLLKFSKWLEHQMDSDFFGGNACSGVCDFYPALNIIQARKRYPDVNPAVYIIKKEQKIEDERIVS